MSFEKLLDQIMDTDKHIRYATICDMEGNEVQTRIREGVTMLLDKDETHETLRYAANAWKSRNKFAPKIGKGKYALVEYEKLKRITMPLDSDHILYITTDVEADHAPIIYKALRLKQDMLHSPSGMP